MVNNASIAKIICHSKRVAKLAVAMGWFPGARYTNLRDVRFQERLYFLDIDWTSYDFQRHLEIAKQMRPWITVAQDILNYRDFDRVLRQACELNKYVRYVVLVPKDKRIVRLFDRDIPDNFILGFSVPSSYGKTLIPPDRFRRPVHLLGGRPDTQRRLADLMPVVSLDCNRFTLDAEYGDYFDGETFRPHPRGGYERCIKESIMNINMIWGDYRPPFRLELQ